MEKASLQTGGPAVWDRFLRGDLGVTIIISGFAVVLTQLISLFTFNRDVLFGRLDDADCYMHLERAWRLMTMGGGVRLAAAHRKPNGLFPWWAFDLIPVFVAATQSEWASGIGLWMGCVA